MNNLTTKQKIILGIIISIMLIIIGIYGYITLNTQEDSVENSIIDNNQQLDQTLENKEMETENENIEKSNQNTRKRKLNCR